MKLSTACVLPLIAVSPSLCQRFAHIDIAKKIAARNVWHFIAASWNSLIRHIKEFCRSNFAYFNRKAVSKKQLQIKSKVVPINVDVFHKRICVIFVSVPLNDVTHMSHLPLPFSNIECWNGVHVRVRRPKQNPNKTLKSNGVPRKSWKYSISKYSIFGFD